MLSVSRTTETIGKTYDLYAYTRIRELALTAIEMAGYPGSLMEGAEGALIKSLFDLNALCDRDPASRFKPIDCHLSVHSAFFAVLCYRLANSLISIPCARETNVVSAMRLSFLARSLTGIDIHPEAKIGDRLIIDHGYGTVIGQTVELGDDAYILNGVTLGGKIISNASNGKRHPTIGHRVQIAANVKILGPVDVGDDVVIGPEVTVTSDLPDRVRVLVRQEHLVVLNNLPKFVG